MTMMMCGHAANATRSTAEGDQPVCAICFTATSDTAAVTVADEPDLSGRLMRCSYDTPGKGGGGKYRRHEPDDSVKASNLRSAFFELGPRSRNAQGWDGDWYYCGCWGWD